MAFWIFIHQSYFTSYFKIKITLQKGYANIQNVHDEKPFLYLLFSQIKNFAAIKSK